MSILEKLLGKKKKEFTAKCDISSEPVEKGYGYLLTTSEVVQSQEYWDNIMTEPETLSYTINHFRKNDSTATQIRKMIFEKYSEINRPWMVSDSYIKWFDIDRESARQRSQKWWEEEGKFQPENTGKAEEVLEKDTYQKVREYAIMKAGKSAVID